MLRTFYVCASSSYIEMVRTNMLLLISVAFIFHRLHVMRREREEKWHFDHYKTIYLVIGNQRVNKIGLPRFPCPPYIVSDVCDQIFHNLFHVFIYLWRNIMKKT